MPRNAAGNYTLPLPPVVTGTTIVASFENATDSDIATELTNSLDRNGRGGMLAPFKIADGTVSAPGIAFTLDPDNGFYRIGADDWAAAVGGAKVMEFTTAGVTIPGGLTTGRILAGDGTVAAPAYSFSSETSLGFTRRGTSVLGVSVAGSIHTQFHPAHLGFKSDVFCSWTEPTFSAYDVGFARASAGLLEVNDGNTLGALRSLRATALASHEFSFLSDPAAKLRWTAPNTVDYYSDAVTGVRLAGYGFCPLGDNYLPCGFSSLRWSVVYAATGTISTSDARLKKDVKESRLGLDFINALHPVSYKWIVGKNVVRQEGEGAEAKNVTVSLPGVRTHWGLIAQDVKKAVDASGVEDFAGYVVDDRTNPDSYLSLRYDEFIAPLIKAVQELSARVVALEAAP